MTPLQRLHAEHGQSPWFDNISRGLLRSGELERMIREDGLRGVTSNPTIFEKAIGSGADYDALLREALASGERDPKRLFELAALRDIREACDLLGPVHAESGGMDGFVSMEVSPELAHDTLGTLREGRRLHEEIARPNAMIKVPATPEGLPAVRALVGEGVPVNVTLIFSVARYEEVVEAYLSGLEDRAKSGRPLSGCVSVASFFVSRIDAAADKELERLPGKAALAGKAAIANAKDAYRRFRKAFSSSRFSALAAQGARVQRPLWASTGTKNPAYSDVLYVEELIGPDTVNTIPPATWDAFRDHGRPRRSLDQGLAQADEALAALAGAGIDLTTLTRELEDAGVRAFADSFKTLLAAISRKADSLAEARIP